MGEDSSTQVQMLHGDDVSVAGDGAMLSGPRRPSTRVAMHPLTTETGRGVVDGADLSEQLEEWAQCLIADAGARYELLELIGRGGQGLVFGVRDHDAGREVALKTLRSDRDLDRHLARFVREAQIMAQLEHPGIVPMYDMGVLPSGTVFYTMKSVAGDSLRAFAARCAERGSRGRFQILTTFQRVCEAMAYAHSRGVIHRDLKPGNIMIGEFGEVMVLDWGLAKVLPGSDLETVTDWVEQPVRFDQYESDDLHTVEGHVVGTPAYMSPEQARAETDGIDGRSDVFALGVILCEMLTGDLPEIVHSGSDRIVDQVGICGYRPLDPRMHDLPRALCAIIDRCLAFTPADRYQSASDIADDIRRFLAGDAVLAYHESLTDRLCRHVRKHRVAVVAAGLALAVAGGVYGVSRWMDWAGREERVAALLAEAEQAELQADYATAIGHYERVEELSSGHPLALYGKVRAEAAVERQVKVLAEAEAERALVARALAQVEEAEALVMAGDIGQLDRARLCYDRALRLLPADHPQRASVFAARDALVASIVDRSAVARAAQAEEHLGQAEAHVVAGDWPMARAALIYATDLVPSDHRIRALERRITAGEAQARQALVDERVVLLLAQAERCLAEERLQAGVDLARAALALDPSPRAAALHERLIEARDEHAAVQEQRRAVHEARLALAQSEQIAEQVVVRGLDQPGLDQRQRQLRRSLLDEQLGALLDARRLAGDQPDVVGALVAFYRLRVLEAERAGKPDEAAAAAAHGRQYDEAGAYRLLFADRCLVRALDVACRVRAIGRDEWLQLAVDEQVELPAGSYTIVTDDGVSFARYFRRGQSYEVQVPTPPMLPPGACFIPGAELSEQTVADFALGRYEITNGEWLAFLRDPTVFAQVQTILEDEDPRRKLRLVPRVSYLANVPLWRVTTGVFGGVTGISPVIGEAGAVDLAAPVVGISLEDINVYLAWRRQRDGINWRLPTSAEWTLAVHGGDEGRHTLWGDTVDLSACYSHAVAEVKTLAELLPVGSFPRDCSVHGVLDLAGSVSEWVASEWDESPGMWLIRGGSWKDRRQERFTAADWRAMDPRQVSTGVGFRLAVSVADGGPQPWPLPDQQ
ncbi:MAG: protein kinase domain-containing protein [Planctomycetota bacterium]